MLHRMRELAVQAGNDTLTTNDRLEIQKEVNQLRSEVDRISYNTEFNTKKLINGSQTALTSSSSQYAQALVTGQVAVGGDYQVKLKVLAGGISQISTSQMFTNKDTGELANGSEKLQDIKQFYDENGHFILDVAQTLTLTGNTRSAQINVDAKMTLNDLAASLQSALVSQQSGLGIANSKVGIVNTAATSMTGLGGYIQMVSGTIGDRGKFSVAGPQSLVDALGFSVARASANNIVRADVIDSYGNSANVKTSSDKAVGLLDGMDIAFESQAAQVATIGGIVDGIKFTADATFTISAAGSDLQIKINQSAAFSMDGLAADINKQIANAIADNPTKAGMVGLEASVVEGQIRLSFNPARVSVANTFNISGASASTSIGFKNGAYVGFADATKAEESTIQGIKKYTSDVTLKVGGLASDGTVANVDIKLDAINSTAGTGDLKEIQEFVVSANQQFESNSANVTASVVNGSLAFTATRIGQENLSSAGPIKSEVTIEVSAAGSTINMSAIRRDLGLEALNHSEGAGDTNFRMHVVATGAQFQIGANAGQNMKVSIGNMSSKALSIDNLDLTSIAGAEDALARIDNALGKVSSERSKLGAYMNRLNYSISNVDDIANNLTASEARIRDVDMASEMIEYTRDQIVSQAGVAMLAQANAVPQNVLSLFG